MPRSLISYRTRPSRRRSSLLLAGGVLACLLGLPFPTIAQTDGPEREYEIKAAFLYHFARFAEWPAGAVPPDAEHLTLCVLGTDPFGRMLDVLTGKPVGDRTLAVRQVHDATEARSCHLLFISTSERAHLQGHLEALRGAHTLTVSDVNGFTKAGGIIQFITTKNRVRFTINAEAARQASLRLSSKLLKLAR